MVSIVKRARAALTAFAQPSAVKSWGGYGLSDWYGGAPGLTSQNRDITFTESGAATAYGIMVEVQRGVMFIADSIAMLPGGIYDSHTDEQLIALDTRQLNINTPGATFIRAIRDYERLWLHNFLDSIVFSDWLYGETFVRRIPNMWGGVVGVRWLNPLYTEPMRTRGRIDHYQYSAEDGYFNIPPAEMAFRIHHRNPMDDLRGISPVLSALPSMNIARNAERGVISYFRNGMILGGVMMPKGESAHLHKIEIDKLKQDMKQHHSGVDQAWRWVIPPVEMIFDAFDQPDLQKNYAVVKDASKKIMMALGVPPELAGNPDSVSYDNADKIMTNWLKVNGKAYASKVASYINTSLLPYFEPNQPVYFKFDFTQVDRQDAALTQADFNAGIIPINVAQAQRGYEVDETLDDIYIIGGKPIHKDVIVQVSKDAAAFGYVTPTPLSLTMPGQAQPVLQAPPQVEVLPEPQKGATSLCVMLSLANNPDLIDLQKRLKTMYPDAAVRWNDPSDFHVTLLYVPSIEDTQVDELVSVLPDTSIEGLSLKVGSLACFDNVGEHALHFRIARNSGLLDAQASLYDTCETMGLQVSGYSRPAQYTPHITMGYLPDRVSRTVFHGKISVQPSGVICSVERGGVDEIVYPVEDDTPPEPEKSLKIEHDGHTHELAIESWNWTRALARKELSAWHAFTTRSKSKRVFDFKYLRGKYADELLRLSSEGLAAGDVVKSVDALIGQSGIEWLQPAFKDALRAIVEDDEPSFTKSIDSIRGDFEARFGAVVNDMQDGSLSSRQRAGNIIRQLLRMFGARAYRQGLEDAGRDSTELDEEEQAEVNQLLSDQSSFVGSLTNAMINEGITPAQADAKAQMWFAGGVNPFYAAGIQAGNANMMLEWKLGKAIEHCETCPRLNGQVHSARAWKKRNLNSPPRVGQATECKGYRCDCTAVPTTAKARGSW